MQRTLLSAAALAAAAVLIFGCTIDPETGRRQFTLFPESVMSNLGASSYQEATAPYREITGTPEAEMVARVSERIVQAAQSDTDIPPEQWTFKLLDAPDTVNAFALPGGKIAVYSGLLQVTQNEDALAAVIGHEVAHVTRNHGNQRVSANVATQIGFGAVELIAGNWSEGDPEARANIAAALGIGTKVADVAVLMPFGRQHELDADFTGLRYMMRAGYDPEEAPKLWERMGALSAGNAPPEFLSTHPSSDRRAERLREAIPRIRAEEGL